MSGKSGSAGAEGALRRIQPDARPDEAGFLNAFDCELVPMES